MAVDIITWGTGTHAQLVGMPKRYMRTMFAPITFGGAGSVTTYRLRAWDSGSGGRWVFWSATTTADPSSSSDTNPNYTGSLTLKAIIGKKVT